MYDPYDMYGYGSGAAALYFGFIIFAVILVIAAYVVSALFLKKIFEKAGVANPNVAWIPIYNYVLFIKLGDVNPILYFVAIAANIVLGAIPVIGFIVSLASLAVFVLAAYRVNQKLQKDPVAFTIFAVLLAPIWLGVIAFGQGVWNTASKPVAGIAPVPPPPWATIPQLMDTTTWGGVPFQGYAATPKAPPAAPPATPPAA